MSRRLVRFRPKLRPEMNVIEREAAPAAGPRPSSRQACRARAGAASQAPPAVVAHAVSRPLSLACDRRAGGPRDRGDHDFGRADRGPADDRFRLLARGCEPDRQLFRRPDRHRGRARSVERGALLSRHHAGRADCGRPARSACSAIWSRSRPPTSMRPRPAS